MLERSQLKKKQDSSTAVVQEIIRSRKEFVQKYIERLLPIYNSK